MSCGAYNTWGGVSLGRRLGSKATPIDNLVLSHCLFGIDLAKCLVRIAHRFGDRFEWFTPPSIGSLTGGLSFPRLGPFHLVPAPN
jgi:hypothetical protein